MESRKIARRGLFTSLSLAIYILEGMLPVLLPVPGLKLGLANIVSLYILYKYGFFEALEVLLARIVLGSIFAGQMISFFYSLAGGILSLIVMALILKLTYKKAVVLVSILGAIFHNVGQMLVAIYMLSLTGIIYYMPYLALASILTGAFNGMVVKLILRKDILG